MIIPEMPSNEPQRGLAVAEYNLLDTLPEEDYDNISKLVATICNVPITLITLLDRDRNFFKSNYGISAREFPRNLSFCGHAILSDEPIFIIEDARLDPRFCDNPFVVQEGAVFYAGVTLVSPEGFSLGSLCIFDKKPRTLNDHQQEALIILGKQVVNLMELRKQNIRLELAHKALIKHNLELSNFASHVSHDLKSPLANIISLTDFLKEDTADKLSEASSEYLGYIKESAFILNNYIDGILKHYKTEELFQVQKEDVTLSELCSEIHQLLLSKGDLLECHGVNKILNINKSALTQILINLVDNALKYNDKSQRKVDIKYIDDNQNHKFLISDNGIGINQDQQENIFDLFTTIKHKDIQPSTGIGLNTVRNLVTKLNGSINVKSEVGVGSVFTLTIAK